MSPRSFPGRVLSISFVIALTALTASALFAQETKFKALVPLSWESMGSQNALDGDVVALDGSHRVYVFHNEPSGWHQKTILFPTVPALCATESLNCFVETWSSVGGDPGMIIAGGSYWQHPPSGQTTWGGTTWIWERNLGGPDAWGLRKTLTSDEVGIPRTPSGSRWGVAVDISGDYLVVSDDIDADVGHAFVFKRHLGGANNWGYLKRIDADTPTLKDFFGEHVAIHDGWLLVGANGDDTVATSAGAAYIYHKDKGGVDAFGLVALLAPSDLGAGEYFSNSLDIHGDIAVVSAFYQNGGRGAVYVFSRNQGGADNWGQVKKLSIPSAPANLRFGYRVATNGSYVAVSAYPSSDYVGEVHIYQKDEGGVNNWGHVTMLQASDGHNGQKFGQGFLSMESNRILISATDDEPGGAAYLYGPLSLDGTIVASAGSGVEGDSLVDFGSGVAVDIQFSGADSGRVTVEMFDSPPQNVSGVAELFVFDDHWLIGGDSLLTFGAATELRFNVSEISTPGFSNPGAVVVYKRPEYGTGSFSPVATSFNGSEIVCSGFTSFSEFVMASNTALPVELTEFGAIAEGDGIHLFWTTASETDNAGFEVEHSIGEGVFERVGFVEGYGSTTERHEYSFEIVDLDPGLHTFRLKQIDLDGQFSYSQIVEATVELPTGFILEPAYPNPFNPDRESTTVKFAVAAKQSVELVLFDVTGRRVRVLHEGVVEANQTVSVGIDGTGLAPGTYFVRLTGEGFTGTREIILMR